VIERPGTKVEPSSREHVGEWISRNRRLVTIVSVVALVIIVFGTIQALLPDRIAGQLPDQGLTGHKGAACHGCSGQEQLVGAGVQRVGGTSYVTIRLGAAATKAILALHFAGHPTIVTLNERSGTSAPWSATISNGTSFKLTTIGVIAQSNDVVVSLPGTSTPALWVTTPAGDRLPGTGSLVATSPATSENWVDLLMIVLVAAALWFGWRRGLRTVARMAVATVVTLGLAFVLYPVVAHVLAGANGSHVGDALAYGLLLALMAVVGLFVARVLEPRMDRVTGPTWLRDAQRPVAAIVAGLGVLLVAAATMSILSGVASFSAAGGAVETSKLGSALTRQWQRVFPAAVVRPDAGAQAQAAAKTLTSVGGSSQACAPGAQVQSVTLTNTATKEVTHFDCGGPGSYPSTPASSYYSYFAEYVPYNGIGIQLVVTGPPLTGPATLMVSPSVSAVSSSKTLADVDFYDNATGALDYATSGSVTLNPNGTVTFQNVALGFSGASYLLNGTMFAPAPGTSSSAGVAAAYLAMVSATNAAVKTFDTSLQSWTATTSAATAQADAAPLLANLRALPAQLQHFASQYPAAASALNAQSSEVATLVAQLEQLRRLKAIGVSSWTNTYGTDLKQLASASNAVRLALGLPALG
jgi:hypothetical protein